jgi:hypothetical protein
MAEGVFAFLSVARQNSFGTANTTSFEYIPFTDESITDTIDILRPETLTGNFFEVDAVRGVENVDGEIGVVMHPEMTGVLLRGVFGQSVPTSTSSGFWEHEFIPKNSNFEAGVALDPYTIQVYRDTETAYEYTDSQLRSLSISLATNEFLSMTVGVAGRVASLMSVVSGTAQSDAPFVFDQASISLDSAAFVEFESIEITFDNNIEGQQTLDGTRQNRFFQRTDKMQVRLSGTMNFLNNSLYVDYKAFTNKSLDIYMKDTSVTSGNEILIQVPRFRIDEYTPNVGGPGRLSADFSATGEVDASSSYAVRITLTNSRAAY